MSADQSFVRAFAGAAARRIPTHMRPGGGRAFGPACATFVRDDGSVVTPVAGYRDAVKARWRLTWWSTKLLFGLRSRVQLPPAYEALAARFDGARTLPVTPAQLAAVAADLAERFPEEARLAEGRIDERLGVPVVELVPRPDELEGMLHGYRANAAQIRDAAARHGVRLAGARVLDVGTGSGYLAFALAGLGAEVVGVDVDPDTYVTASERAQMRELLAGPAGSVELRRADVHALPFEDGSFDLVISMTAVEHFTDVRLAFREMARVLAPGGVTHHGVDPWFGIAGGHSLCTLDFPWGHLRLSPDETERYLREQRPNEAADAIALRREGFQSPPLTLAESRQAVEAAGLEILRWHEQPLPARSLHRAAATARVLRDCRRFHPRVTRNDLLTLTYTVTARR
jgi:SAM-dependent methyltransferase